MWIFKISDIMKKTLHVLAGIVIASGFLAAAGAIVMLLWNAVLPAVTGWAAINFWQALALFVLVHLLTFPMLHPHGGGRGHHHFHGNMSREEARQWNESMRRMGRKMHGMSREERLQFLRERFDVSENA